MVSKEHFFTLAKITLLHKFSTKEGAQIVKAKLKTHSLFSISFDCRLGKVTERVEFALWT